MEALEVSMNNHNINIDSSSNSSFYGHALSTSLVSFNETSTYSSNEWLLDFGTSYHMDKYKVFVSDDISLSVVGSRIVQLDYGNCNDVLYVPSLSYNIISVYQITHSSEGKIVDFSPHQVVIKALKDVRMS